MERLERDVRAQLRRLAPPSAGPLEAINAAWPTIAGSTAASHSLPQRLAADGALHVAASSSTWAYELGRLAPVLLAELRELLGDAAPRALRVAPGRIPGVAGHTEAPLTAPVEVGPEERGEAVAMTARIKDERFRELVARAAAASLARARSDRGF